MLWHCTCEALACILQDKNLSALAAEKVTSEMMSGGFSPIQILD